MQEDLAAVALVNVPGGDPDWQYFDVSPDFMMTTRMVPTQVRCLMEFGNAWHRFEATFEVDADGFDLNRNARPQS